MGNIYKIWVHIILILLFFVIWYHYYYDNTRTNENIGDYRVFISSNFPGGGTHVKALDWIVPYPKEKNNLIFIFNYTKKEIGIASLYLSKQLPTTKNFKKESFNKIFSEIKLTEKEKLQFPDWTDVLYYQQIKWADFDSFMIYPWGYYAQDKNEIYTFSPSNDNWIVNWWSNKLSVATDNKRESWEYLDLTPMDSKWNYFPYYFVMSGVNKDNFHLFQYNTIIQHKKLFFGRRGHEENINKNISWGLDVEHFMKANTSLAPSR